MLNNKHTRARKKRLALVLKSDYIIIALGWAVWILALWFANSRRV